MRPFAYIKIWEYYENNCGKHTENQDYKRESQKKQQKIDLLEQEKVNLVNKVQEKQQKIDELEKQKQNIGNEAQQIQQKINQLEQEEETLAKESHGKQANIEKLEEEKLKIDIKNESPSEEIASLESEVKYQAETIKSMNSRIEKYHFLLQSKESEIEVLKDMSNLEKDELKSQLDRYQSQSHKFTANSTINSSQYEENKNATASNNRVQHVSIKREPDDDEDSALSYKKRRVASE